MAHQIKTMWGDDSGGQQDEYWSQEEHVFQVLLCNLHHNITTTNSDNDSDGKGVEIIDVDSPTPYVTPAKKFLKSIQALLPEYYIQHPLVGRIL